ncbi:hypothetical protein ACFVMC_01195 [Nocardia sp. NPDC127579]|uniref:WXG100-like domain-containing protein n=1 Tax=Nocardia sp. NPDC127579 TaxID=3345402 RepID=UPI00363D8BA3
MGIEIPDALKPVASLVVYQWPETDETSLWEAADKWDEMASLIGQVNDYGGDVVKVVLANTQGETHDSIEQFWNKAGGDDGALADLQEFCENLATALRIMAALVLAVKLFIISMLVYLVVQLAIAAAAAIPSGGTSAAAGAAVQVSVRTMITQALKKLLENITKWTIIKGAVFGAGVGFGKEFGFQSLEKFLGVRDGYDWGELASDSVRGAVVGAIAAPVQQMLKNQGLGNLPGDNIGWKVGDTFGPTAMIAKTIGNKVVGTVWEDEGIAERSKEVGTKVIRKEIVEELTEQSNQAQPNSQKPSTADQGSSLDLPVQK